MLKVLVGQLGIGAVLAAALWGLYGHVAGYSALLGSLTCVIPNAFLALRLVVPRRDPGARALIRAAYIGELGKLGLTVLMFSIVFVLVRPLSAVALFAGFIAAQLVTFAGFLLRDKAATEETTSNNNG
ncbi:MAG: F0F1 ATP synthase subunit I [Woeseiaceae bacterium]|nr:F0F1 ATP synthase subunit I [Woeseiaceae bacterium]NIP20616.1 F0F1 ATP synthase subunit I [Woeseiaceae bacterium]NIS89409.1 F0F1 ATP synthase subunit I [Woeseiaceae bacterium]